MINDIQNIPISNQRIIDCLKTDYGIDIATLIPLHLGADINASVYKAQAHDLSSYFVKLKRGKQHDVGATIIAWLKIAQE